MYVFPPSSFFPALFAEGMIVRGIKRGERVTKNILAGNSGSALTHSLSPSLVIILLPSLPGSILAPFLCLNSTLSHFFPRMRLSLGTLFTLFPGSQFPSMIHGSPFVYPNSYPGIPYPGFPDCFRNDLIIGPHLFIQSHSICHSDCLLVLLSLFPADYRPDKSICFL